MKTEPIPAADNQAPSRSRAFMAIRNTGAGKVTHTVTDTKTGEQITLPANEAWNLHQKLNAHDDLQEGNVGFECFGEALEIERYRLIRMTTIAEFAAFVVGRRHGMPDQRLADDLDAFMDTMKNE